MTPQSLAEQLRPFLLGCCAVALLVVVAAVFVVFRIVVATSGAVDDARLQSDRFLTALERHDFAGAMSLMTPDAQAANSEGKLNALIRTFENKHGKAIRHSPSPSFHFSEDNKQVSLSYWERWEQTETTVLIDMYRQKDGWRVNRFDFLER